jgi:hypothetical protein
MADSLGITAVKWSWRSDTSWIDFDKGFNYKLETAYHSADNSVKKVKVDKERFIDLTLLPSDIKKQFQKTDCKDSELLGIQKRYDDETKRRAVKRGTPVVLFKGVNLFIAIDDDDAEIFNAVKAHGATVSKNVVKATKVIITTQKTATDSSSSFSGDIAKAQNLNIPVVKLECLIDALNDEDELDYDNKKYHIKITNQKEEQEKMEVEKNLKTLKRKADEEEEEDEATDVKKRKTNVKSDVKTTAAATSSTSTTATSTTQSSIKADSSGLPVMIYVPSSWAGVCSYEEEDFPFQVELSSMRGTKMTGTVVWPTLGNAKTKLRGTIEGNSFKFEEYEAISGAESVQIPSFYSGVIKNNGKTIEGRTVSGGDASEDDAAAEDAKFKIDLVADESSEEELVHSMLKEGSKFNGTSFIENTFTLKIASRKGNAVQGTIYWDETKTESKFKGQVEDGKLSIEEFDNPSATPMNFEGQINNSTIEGKCGFGTGKLNKKFTINMS